MPGPDWYVRASSADGFELFRDLDPTDDGMCQFAFRRLLANARLSAAAYAAIESPALDEIRLAAARATAAFVMAWLDEASKS